MSPDQFRRSRAQSARLPEQLQPSPSGVGSRSTTRLRQAVSLAANSTAIDDAAIALARASIDRWMVDSSCEESSTDTLDVDGLEAALEMLGSLGVGSLASKGDSIGRPFKIGRFEVLGERGRGGFGVVLKAMDPLLEREVALKLPHPESLIAGHSPDEFVREAQVAARLQHPGIVRIYEARRLGPVWYIASAYCEGPTLAEWIDRRETPLPPKSAAQLLAAVADAVHYAHSRGILHLDLKPENILLEAANHDDVPQPLVTDFGLSGRSDCDRASMPLRIAGTVGYMAPEQCEGDPARIGVTADVYALGAILRELLHGESRRDEIAPADRPSAPRSPTEDLTAPRDLEAISRKCLAKDPNLRYESARDVADELRRYIRGECVVARPVAWPTRLLRLARRRPAIAALVMLLAGTLVVSMAALTTLWQRAEAHLARFRAEKQLRSQISDRMQETLLNFAWLTQEGGLQDFQGYTNKTAATEALHDFLSDVREWSAAVESHAPLNESLFAAMHSLALVQGVEPSDDAAQHKEFRDGVLSWKAVIEQQPERLQWRRALAMHLLTYTARERDRNWLAWRSGEYPLDRQTIEQIEEPYAELLIEFSHAQLRDHLVEPSYGMLHAAIVILEGRPQTSDEFGSRSKLLLSAYSQLALAAKFKSRPEESLANVAKAEQLVALAPPIDQCDSLLAGAIADTYQARATLMLQKKQNVEPLQMFERAIVFRERELTDAPDDARLRLDLVALHVERAKIYASRSNFAAAGGAYEQAIAVVNAGVARLPGHRHLLSRRAMLAAAQGEAWLAGNRPARAQIAFEAATSDFKAINLCRRDGRTTWIASIRSLQSLGDLYAEQGLYAASIAAYEASLESLAELKPRMPNHPQHSELTQVSERRMAQVRTKLKESATHDGA